MSTQFTIYVPVSVEVDGAEELKFAWDALREHGGGTYSSSYRVVFHSERIRLKDMVAAFEAKKRPGIRE